MTRITIVFPNTILYREEKQMFADEMNRGGHLGFERAVALIAGVRIRFFHHFGIHDVDSEGRGIIISDLAVRYKAEILAGERLRIEVAAGNPAKKGCDIFYRILKASSGRAALLAKTGIVFFDYSERRTIPMPEAFRQRLFGFRAGLTEGGEENDSDTGGSRPPDSG